MSCSDVRNRLLAGTDSRELPRGDREHLDRCRPCRSFLRASRRLDGGLRQLPVPDSLEARERVISGFQGEVRLPFAQAAKQPNRFWTRWTAGVAAAVMFIALGMNVYRSWDDGGLGQPPPAAKSPRDRLLANLVDRHAELMRADTTEDRLAELNRLAGDLRDHSCDLRHVAKAEEMADLADWYVHVVRDGLLVQAGQVPEADTAVLEGFADELRQTGTLVDDAADFAPDASVRHLRRIARTAREGDEYLRRLIRGGA